MEAGRGHHQPASARAQDEDSPLLLLHTTRYYRGEKIVKGDGVVGYKPGEKVPGDLPKNRAQMEHEEQAPNPFTETRDKDGRFNPAAPRLCAVPPRPPLLLHQQHLHHPLLHRAP